MTETGSPISFSDIAEARRQADQLRQRLMPGGRNWAWWRVINDNLSEVRRIPRPEIPWDRVSVLGSRLIDMVIYSLKEAKEHPIETVGGFLAGSFAKNTIRTSLILAGIEGWIAAIPAGAAAGAAIGGVREIGRQYTERQTVAGRAEATILKDVWKKQLQSLSPHDTERLKKAVISGAISGAVGGVIGGGITYIGGLVGEHFFSGIPVEQGNITAQEGSGGSPPAIAEQSATPTRSPIPTETSSPPPTSTPSPVEAVRTPGAVLLGETTTPTATSTTVSVGVVQPLGETPSPTATAGTVSAGAPVPLGESVAPGVSADAPQPLPEPAKFIEQGINNPQIEIPEDAEEWIKEANYIDKDYGQMKQALVGEHLFKNNVANIAIEKILEAQGKSMVDFDPNTVEAMRNHLMHVMEAHVNADFDAYLQEAVDNKISLDKMEELGRKGFEDWLYKDGLNPELMEEAKKVIDVQDGIKEAIRNASQGGSFNLVPGQDLSSIASFYDVEKLGQIVILNYDTLANFWRADPDHQGVTFPAFPGEVSYLIERFERYGDTSALERLKEVFRVNAPPGTTILTSVDPVTYQRILDILRRLQ